MYFNIWKIKFDKRVYRIKRWIDDVHRQRLFDFPWEKAIRRGAFSLRRCSLLEISLLQKKQEDMSVLTHLPVL